MKALRKLLADKWTFLVEVGLFAVILLNPAFFTQENYMIRRYLYVGVLILLISIMWFTGFPMKKLGLSATNLDEALKAITLPTLLFCLGLIAIRIFLPNLLSFGLKDASAWWVVFKIFTYVVISVPMQELVFRGYFITRLESFTEVRWPIVILSSTLFSISHAPFGILFITIGSAIIGLVYAYHFIRYRNLYSLMLSHGVIGLLLILFINL